MVYNISQELSRVAKNYTDELEEVKKKEADKGKDAPQKTSIAERNYQGYERLRAADEAQQKNLLSGVDEAFKKAGLGKYAKPILDGFAAMKQGAVEASIVPPTDASLSASAAHFSKAKIDSMNVEDAVCLLLLQRAELVNNHMGGLSSDINQINVQSSDHAKAVSSIQAFQKTMEAYKEKLAALKGSAYFTSFANQDTAKEMNKKYKTLDDRLAHAASYGASEYKLSSDQKFVDGLESGELGIASAILDKHMDEKRFVTADEMKKIEAYKGWEFKNLNTRVYSAHEDSHFDTGNLYTEVSNADIASASPTLSARFDKTGHNDDARIALMSSIGTTHADRFHEWKFTLPSGNTYYLLNNDRVQASIGKLESSPPQLDDSTKDWLASKGYKIPSADAKSTDWDALLGSVQGDTNALNNKLQRATQELTQNAHFSDQYTQMASQLLSTFDNEMKASINALRF